MRYLYLLLVFFLFHSCKNIGKSNITHLVNEWKNKEIIFPIHSIFTIQGKDTVDFSFLDADFKIVSYVDSMGCTGCKLQLPRWKKLMFEVDTLTATRVPVVFYFHPKNVEDLHYIINHEAFTYPICIDEFDEFNALNHFPKERAFQTFLLNKENKVIAIGNPILNPKVKELYLRIISGNTSLATFPMMTEVSVDSMRLNLGTFIYSKAQERKITLTNEGESPLFIQDVITSCGCTKVIYNKKPVSMGKKLELTVVYKAEKAEYFSKTITIYCNAKSSPIFLKITGKAE